PAEILSPAPDWLHGRPSLARRCLVKSRLVILLPILLLAGCVSVGGPDGPDGPNSLPTAAANLLDRADRIVVLVLDPSPRNLGGMVSPDGKPVPPPPPDEREDFHGYSVIGKTIVVAPLARRNLVGAVKQGIAASDGSAAACFNPRHGLRA